MLIVVYDHISSKNDIYSPSNISEQVIAYIDRCLFRVRIIWFSVVLTLYTPIVHRSSTSCIQICYAHCSLNFIIFLCKPTTTSAKKNILYYFFSLSLSLFPSYDCTFFFQYVTKRIPVKSTTTTTIIDFLNQMQ
jgi:hypothetical protein